MSPGVTAAYPELFALFGGRQSARTLHFAVACLLVLFLVVHVAQVFVGGAGNLMRSMITGRFRVPPATARPPFAEPPDA
jgi:thiosulfate reductase cytochrome b subunit